MLDSSNFFEYKIKGTVKIADEKICMELSGVRTGAIPPEKISSRTFDLLSHPSPDQQKSRFVEQSSSREDEYQNNTEPKSFHYASYRQANRSVNLSPSRKARYQINSDIDASRAKNSNASAEQSPNYEEALVDLLLAIPGVNSQNAQKRNELFKYVSDPQKRRVIRNLQAGNRYLDDPLRDVQEFVDYLKDTDELEGFLIKLSTLYRLDGLDDHISEIQKNLSNQLHQSQNNRNFQIDPPKIKYREPLFDKIYTTFNEDDVKELCFFMDIPTGDIKGNTLRVTIVNLIKYCERRDRIMDLVNKLEKQRPHVDWRELTISLP